jgi:hypothetical protein
LAAKTQAADQKFATTENVLTPASNVTFDSYTRVDAAAFYRFNDRLRAQANIENLFGENYYLFANRNTNITLGSPRAVRASTWRVSHGVALMIIGAFIVVRHKSPIVFLQPIRLEVLPHIPRGLRVVHFQAD